MSAIDCLYWPLRYRLYPSSLRGCFRGKGGYRGQSCPKPSSAHTRCISSSWRSILTITIDIGGCTAVGWRLQVWSCRFDYSRSHGAQKRSNDFEKVFVEEAEVVSKGTPADVIALDEALSRLAEFDREYARLVEMRFFGGLSLEEAAGVLGVSRTTVKRNWNLCKAWLARELRKGDRKDA